MRFIFIYLIISINVAYSNVDWSASATLPGEAHCYLSHGHKVCLTSENRSNIYNVDKEELEKLSYEGSKHVMSYPVEITRMRLPKAAMDKFFESDTSSALRRFIFKIAKFLTNFKNWNDVFSWLGLHEYPVTVEDIGPNTIPDMGDLEKFPMGVTQFHHGNSISMSFSCAACHSSDLFGVKIIGLTNRFPRANETFIKGKQILSSTPSFMFDLLVGPTNEDLEIFKESKDAMKYVGLKKPLALGLDTSLAQVGLSLAKRGLDPYAKMNPFIPTRPNPLEYIPADSKPAVWWNLKYKTKWLSDGSIDSGNPIHTNFLWNEIGRGVDLYQLENWLDQNRQKIKELTAFIFQTKAPKYNDFFPNKIDISSAKRGEKLFNKTCSGCHGKYEKAWSDNESELSYNEELETTNVWYHKKTPNINVETDKLRREGMKYFYKDLNRLNISKSIGTVVTPKKGYTPPPLVGIWARYPYFHNNSVPTLYDILTPDFKRPKSYISVPAKFGEKDFDHIKGGYPSKNNIREPYRSNREHYFDTRVKGLSNRGHTKMMVDEYGNDKFSHEEKLDIVQYLLTL